MTNVEAASWEGNLAYRPPAGESARSEGLRSEGLRSEGNAVIEVVARVVLPLHDLDAAEAHVARGLRELSERVEGARTRAFPEPHRAIGTARLRSVSSDGDEPKLTIFVPPRRVELAGRKVDLTRLEFDLLLFLCENPGRVHPRDVLLNHVWQVDTVLDTRTVDVHIRRLRRKLGPGFDLISTVRGVGYRLDKQDEVEIEYDPTPIKGHSGLDRARSTR